ncbi:MAG: deoxynucleoside kinase [Oscillospiraceae bacterium]|nr:deoxynucleoside kinase [Oscillospiraceae bacterium]
MSNRLVVLEGLDGSGKSTQYELLQKFLGENNVDFKAISFPDYDKPSSALVKMYLGGEFSKNAADINAYAASSFYAVDRYASYKLYWEKEYNEGYFILAARYVTSNAIYQMVKLPEDKWDEYLDWLSEYEYEKLQLPKPDKVIFLDMPVEVSQKLLSGRYDGDESKKDIHEVNVDFLNACRKAALFTAKKQGWVVIPCSDGENPFSIESISDTLKGYVKEML